MTIYRLVAKGTLEQKIVDLHRRKRDLALGLLEGTETGQRLDPEALMALIREG